MLRRGEAQAGAGQQGAEVVGQEADVLEVTQHKQVDADGGGQPSAPGAALGTVHAQGHPPVEAGAADEQGQEPGVPAGVKKPAGDEQPVLARGPLRGERVNGEHRREEGDEGGGVELHAMARGAWCVA